MSRPGKPAKGKGGSRGPGKPGGKPSAAKAAGKSGGGRKARPVKPRSGRPRRTEGGRQASAPPPRTPSAGEPPLHENSVYGLHPVQEALRAGRREVRRVFATEPHLHDGWLRGVEVHVADADWLTARCGSPSHQGLCADVAPYPYVGAAELLLGDAPLIVALDEVQDPQNLGSIARTAECAGATGLVIPERRSAEVTAAVAKASAGAVEHLRIAQVRNLTDFLGAAKEAGCWCFGADSTEDAVAWTGPDWSGPVVLVMGAEGKGLRPRVAAACDARVSLPLKGRIQSLNVGAAAAALLYEVVRARA